MGPGEYPGLLDDKRAIQCLHFLGEGFGLIEVGRGDVTAITVEAVPGQNANVPWFRVWHGKSVASRWNAAHLEGVVYVGGQP